MSQHWGATSAEINSEMPGDDLIDNPALNATRAISIGAPPERVFPWLRQMGFGRGGWYSYDIIDNLGRRSATSINPDWQRVTTGDPIPGGPVDFTAVVVDPPHRFAIALGDPTGSQQRVQFTLAYRLDEHELGTRLVTRARSRINLPGGRFTARFLLGPGDGIMLRKQLRTLKARAERFASSSSGVSTDNEFTKQHGR